MITVIGLFQEPSWVFTNKEKCTAFTNLLCVIHVNQCFKKIILSQMETTGFMNNGNDIIFFKYIYTNGYICVALMSKIKNNNSNPKQNLNSQKSCYAF